MKRWTGLALAGVSLALGGAGGYWVAQQRPAPMPEQAATPDERKALYWYDPMYPQHKFDKPGKSPFMDMQLVPQYADAGGDTATLRIDPSLMQNLGARLATVTRGQLASQVRVVGMLSLNARDIAVVQARTGGFVERVYARAPGDLLPANAPLVDLLVPEWAAAQEEFLALKRSGDAELLAAARQRLRLVGMPAELVARVERSGKVQPVQTLASPIAGLLQELDVRQGMTIAAGDTLVRINGLASVWLEAAVPEAQAGALAPGQPVRASLPAFAGETFAGSIGAILPEANPDSRTLRVRIELPNPDGRLRPGMSAQVNLEQAGGKSQLLIPSEAVIRTGRRNLVMLAEEGGRYRPVEVEVGLEAGGQTAVLRGLNEGQQVVASGQFLLDSEASLKGLLAPREEIQP